MVMETTLRKDVYINDLRTLGPQLQILLDDTPLKIKCTLNHERLVILGQHTASASINTAEILGRLERNIQALQIKFAQQVQLYLRVAGHKKPYARRRFVLAPPPPPMCRVTPSSNEVLPLIHSPDDSQAILEDHVAGGNSGCHEPIVDDLIGHGLVSDNPTSDTSDRGSQIVIHDSARDRHTSPMRDTPIGNDHVTHPIEHLAHDPVEHQGQNSDQHEESESGTPIPSDPAPTIELENSSLEEQPWIVSDDELNALIHQLTMAHMQAPCPNPVLTPDPSAARSEGESLGPSTSNALLVISPSEQQGIQTGQSSDESPEPHLLPEEQSPVESSPSVALATAGQLTPVISETVSESSLTPQRNDLDLNSEAGPLVHTLHTLTYETSQRLRELSGAIFQPKTGLVHRDAQRSSTMAQVGSDYPRRVAIATAGVATLGVATLYGVTRPCVFGTCQPLQDADVLGEKSVRVMQQASTWPELEAVIPTLTQAIELLEPIPSWSSHAVAANAQLQTYRTNLEDVAHLMQVEKAAEQANVKMEQVIYSVENLQQVRSRWELVVEDLETISSDSPLHGFAQAYVADYHPHLEEIDHQLQQEKMASATLDTAKEAAQLAQARQGIAKTLENWQFARLTWTIALERLNRVPTETLAASEAERLRAFYETSLEAVNTRVSQARVAATSLEKALQQAQIAAAAEQRYDWSQAIADWQQAILYTQQIDNKSTYFLKAEEIRNQYQNSVANAQEKLKMKTQVENELKQSCAGELRLCHIVSIDQSIKLKLDETYMDAITAARGNSNRNLQAIVTDHQLRVRAVLDRIANDFEIPIEVYNPHGGLLERHIPKTE